MASLTEYQAAVTTSAPDVWWRFDDASGLPQDSSGNGLHMTSETINSYEQQGPFSGWEAILMQGGEGTSRAAINTLTNNMSFEIWVRPQIIAAQDQRIFSNLGSFGSGWTVEIRTNGQIRVDTKDLGYQALSAGSLPLNLWSHIVVVRDSGTWKYYINGQLDTANAGTTAPGSSVTTTTIHGSGSFQARYAQAGFYNRVLTPTEILAHYEAGAGVPTDAIWEVGVINVPGSTGSASVTGLGGTPKAVFFFGTNWTTEDVGVTTAGTGLFRGMAAPHYSNPSAIVQGSAFIIPAGLEHIATDTSAIIARTDATATVYEAQVTSLDSDGFTLNWSTVTSGHKVIYVALMDVQYSGAFSGVTNQTGLVFGWKAGASLLHGAWAGPLIGGTDRTQEFYGGGAYPTTSSSNWMSAGMGVHTFPTSASQQYDLRLVANGPHIRIAPGVHFTGPFLTGSNIKAYPTGGGQTNMTFEGDSEDGGMIVAWNDEDTSTWFPSIPASQGDQTTKNDLTYSPGLLIGYSISDEPDGQGTGGRGAAGFAVVTPDFQWCALVDGVSSRGSFQSFQRGFCDAVNGTNVHAGTVEVLENGITMTTEEDDISAGSFLWHAFGHPQSKLPQIYRYYPGE